MLTIEPDHDAAEQEQVADPIRETFEPSPEGRVGKFDACQHSVHLVEQAGDVEQECARDVRPVIAARKSHRGENADYYASECDRIRSHVGVREPPDGGTAEPTIE